MIEVDGLPLWYNNLKQFIMSEIRIIENTEFSSYENLFYQHKGDVVCLHDDEIGELGWIRVWYDSEMDEREYITLNEVVVYLDTLDEL